MRDMVNIIIMTRSSCQRQVASADKLHVKAAKILPFVGLARSKQDPTIRRHGAQCMYRPPPAGARDIFVANSVAIHVLHMLLGGEGLPDLQSSRG